MPRLKAPPSTLTVAAPSCLQPTARQSGRTRYPYRWEKAARDFRAAHPLCLGCQAIDRTAETTQVDHIQPHRGDQRLMWDEENWQPACDWHHNSVKQILEQRFDAGLLSVEDLRLDSAVAVELSRELIAAGRGPGGGV